MRLGVFCLAAIIGAAAPAIAQQPEGALGARRVPHARPGLGRQGAAPQGERLALERDVRQAFAKAARERVGLSEDQMSKLAAVNQQLAPQRRGLAEEERSTRVALRQEMLDPSAPDQAKIGVYLDRLRQLQRRRFDIGDAEQKELAAFMTPLQRARYQALQEQVRHRLDDIRHQHPDQTLPGAPPPDGGSDR